MPGRRIPPQIAAYLGPCREPDSPAEKVVEQCGLAKLMGDERLTDYDPLVVVMHLVTEEVEGLRLSLKKAKGRKAWGAAMTILQKGHQLEHNTFIPCRTCDQAFEPVIDDELLTLFLTWYESHNVQDLLTIHRCPQCGGRLKAVRTKPYKGDMHTPEPGSVENDEEWAESLLQHSSL